MKKKYIFNDQINLEEYFLYVSSPASKSKKKFLQRNNCIENSYNEEIADFDYISMVTKERVEGKLTLITKCSFVKFGAPLIVLTDDLRLLDDGTYQYGVHFEIVAYENGCNVWHIVPGLGQEAIKVTKVNSKEFLVKENSIIEIKLTIEGKRLYIQINDQQITAEHEEIPEKMHVGITACEGINQFYELEVDKS